ncbi:MAG: DUF4386 domain-containing protein [Chloroflexota bacterium]|nr:DUF4386 domain-containing protein [Chloroflexota bacterium]
MNRRITGIMLILVPIAFNAAFFALGSAFEYPDILRQPTDNILRQFVEGGPGLVNLWYVFAVTSLLAIPLALLLYGVFRDEYPQIAQAATIVGVLSGLVQAFGLFRWVFLVPGLAAAYVDPATDPATAAATAVVFESAHQYLGVAIGEHLGYVFTGSWTILLSVMMFRSRTFAPWLGIIGIVSAIGIMVGLLEPAGVGFAGAVNAISYILWSLWLIVLGVILLLRPAPENSVPR